MKKLIKTIGTFLSGCAAVWLHAYAVTMLWSWFVVSTFGLPALTIPVALGLHVLYRLVVTNPRVKVELVEDAFFVDGASIALSLIALAAGWVIHSYCM